MVFWSAGDIVGTSELRRKSRKYNQLVKGGSLTMVVIPTSGHWVRLKLEDYEGKRIDEG